jgi:molybdopterin-synthase adenylyltransferase
MNTTAAAASTGRRDYSRLDGTLYTRDRVRSLKALVVGAGALGNEVIKNLALIGVGEIVILDRDHLEASNLTRSVLFCTADVSAHLANRTPKARLAAKRAAELNPDVRVTPHVGEVADCGLGIIRRADVVFSCLDNEMARLELSWACVRLNRPLVDGGLGLRNPSSGMVSFFPGAGGPCFACREAPNSRSRLLQELQGREDSCWLKERRQAEEDVVSTTPVMASVIGALQVEMALRSIVTPPRDPTKGEAQRVTLHPRLSAATVSFERSAACPLHDPASVIRCVNERADRTSSEWTPAALLDEYPAEAILLLDWPVTARAGCRACGHTWEPWVRRARFRLARCPACGGSDIGEQDVVSAISRGSEWATRSFSALGLPPAHVWEIAEGCDATGPRHHVEVTGDLALSMPPGTE